VTVGKCSKLLLVAAALGAGCSAPAAPPFKPVADNKLLMQAVVDPNADVIWEAVKTILTPESTEEIRPKTDEQWTAVRNSAIALAESGNLLMLAPRAKDSGEWMKAAQQLVETGTDAMHAAEAKNPDRLFTIGGDIYEACSNCHQKYMEAIVNANR
jgi:hypothetical protein